MVYQPKLSIKLVMAGVVLASNLGSLAQVRMAVAAAESGPAATAAKPSAKPMNGAAHGVPETPTRPPTPEMLPPQAPQVTYQNGMLGISASNSTLGQVLLAVQAETGASVEYPTAAASERVAVQLGPDRPSDVLAKLLNGSNFGFIILGVPGDSSRVQKVILTAQQATYPSVVSDASNANPLAVAAAATSSPQAMASGVHPARGRPGEPAILRVPGRTDLPVKGNTALQNIQNDAQNLQRTEFWMQIAREHAQRMSDPKNQDAAPPPPPPMEVPPPTQ